jgi:uncharacterized membrane protein
LLASLDSEGIVWSLIFCGGVAGSTAAGLYQGTQALRGDASKVAPSFGLLALAGVGFWLFSRAVAPSFAALLGGLAGIHVLFFYLLSAPTRAGRRVLDQVEGFKMFLTAVEGDRLRIQGATVKTPELYEKYLPYALALDVEHQWAEQFTEVFARVAQTDVSRDQGYSPSWYSGPDRKHRSASDFAKAVGPSLSRAVTSSSTAPASQTSDRGPSSFGRSSGSGGRGSSGGGGGGGGGGGW